MENTYEERKKDIPIRRAFKTLCKTLEFQTRLNLSSVVFDILGMENKWISIEVGYSGIVFECVY
ncbi:hypothetical protein C2S52_022038 [Perilla frutescens var. hirtella]|nr:hypothetical protein C2S52_022038 [Perilla frutescens var. hirtella]KAH6807554.1 hypothetical protein C2S51_028662 [Perilla frutescens var. frutescens]